MFIAFLCAPFFQNCQFVPARYLLDVTVQLSLLLTVQDFPRFLSVISQDPQSVEIMLRLLYGEKAEWLAVRIDGSPVYGFKGNERMPQLDFGTDPEARIEMVCTTSWNRKPQLTALQVTNLARSFAEKDCLPDAILDARVKLLKDKRCAPKLLWPCSKDVDTKQESETEE